MVPSALPATRHNSVILDLRAAIDGAADQRSGTKWRQLFDVLCEAIAAGKLQPGERLPTETALAPALDLSIGTVRKALAELATAGLIVRHKKTGSFVTDQGARAGEVFVYRFRDAETGQMALPFVHTMAVERDGSAGPWSRFLGQRNLVRLDRLVWFDDEPPAHSSVYFLPEHGEDLLVQSAASVGRSSMHRMMIERFGLPTLRMEHTIACGPLPPGVCAAVGQAADTVGTIWDIRDHSLQDRPILYQRYHLPPGHRPIELQERFGPVPASAGPMVAFHHNNEG